MYDKIIISLILRSKIIMDKNKLQKFRRLFYLRYKEYFDNLFVREKPVSKEETGEL
jgi:hypothetical protein